MGTDELKAGLGVTPGGLEKLLVIIQVWILKSKKNVSPIYLVYRHATESKETNI